MKNIIIVEGKDDVSFFTKLLGEKFFKGDNDDKNEVIPTGGFPNMINFEEIIKRSEFENADNLIFICDADESYVKRKKQLEGLISKIVKNYPGKTAFYYILPFNKEEDEIDAVTNKIKQAGSLENLILEVIEQEKEEKFLKIKNCAEGFFKCVEEVKTKQSKSKLIIQAILSASTPNDDSSYSISKILEGNLNYLSNDNQKFFQNELLQNLKNSILKLLK